MEITPGMCLAILSWCKGGREGEREGGRERGRERGRDGKREGWREGGGGKREERK